MGNIDTCCGCSDRDAFSAHFSKVSLRCCTIVWPVHLGRDSRESLAQTRRDHGQTYTDNDRSLDLPRIESEGGLKQFKIPIICSFHPVADDSETFGLEGLVAYRQNSNLLQKGQLS